MDEPTPDINIVLRDIVGAMRDDNPKRKRGGARAAVLPVDPASIIDAPGTDRTIRQPWRGERGSSSGRRRKPRTVKPNGTPLTAAEAAERQAANRERANHGPIGGYVGNID